MKTTLRNPTYFLGTTINGSTYIYTALGSFRSAAAAARRCREKRATIFLQYECWRSGVNYGSTGYEAVGQSI